MKRHGKNILKLNKKGQTLILSYLVVTSFIVLAAGLMVKAIAEKNITDRQKMWTEAFYMAEGANESAIAAFASGIANYQIATNVATFNWTTTFSTFGNATVNSTVTRLEAGDRLVVEGGANATINIYECNYEVRSTAVHPHNNNISVTVHQIISRRLIPTFQHAVFYNSDLEMLPGANMTLSGRIHSNQDIYLGTNATLTIDTTYLRSAGDIYNKRKDDPGAPLTGETSIRINKSGSPQFADMAGLDSTDPTWVADSNARWQGTVQSSAHGVTTLTAPSVATTAPGGYYATNANVVITDNSIVKNGSTLVEGVDYPSGTVTKTTASFYNNREQKYIIMTTVDMSKLAGKTGTCNGHACANNLPSNGLVYATRDDAYGGEPGIKLINGSEIVRGGGLTVVSNQPVYIQGNYNTVSEKPASVIADSVNLLSGNWNDTNSTRGLSSRNAAPTTYNVAFVAGIDDTSVGNYNGGLENYPRLHENWTGQTLTIKGSFVALWNSSVATGPWVYGAPQYTAPNRSWSYNTNYNNVNNLPPFTPWAVEAQRVAWWTD